MALFRRRPAVLVVDDDEDSRELLVDVLRVRGFQVESRDSGMACLDSLASGEFAVVLTDVEMPGMTGLELCREIRERDPDVVAIVMTGCSTPTLASEAKHSGASAFFRKPVDLDSLANALRAALAS